MNLTPQKRYLGKIQCKTIATQLSKEMREDREGREKWGDMWFVSRGNLKNGFQIGQKLGYLVIPGEMEAGKAVIERLFHPEEAAIIIKHLTDGE